MNDKQQGSVAFKFAQSSVLLTVANDLKTFRFHDTVSGREFESVRGAPLPDNIMMFDFWLLRTVDMLTRDEAVQKDPVLLDMISQINDGLKSSPLAA